MDMCGTIPLAEAYIRHNPPPHNRPTWDLTSVLYAVLPDRGYFDVSPRGRASNPTDYERFRRPRKEITLSDPEARTEASRARGPGAALQPAAESFRRNETTAMKSQESRNFHRSFPWLAWGLYRRLARLDAWVRRRIALIYLARTGWRYFSRLLFQVEPFHIITLLGPRG